MTEQIVEVRKISTNDDSVLEIEMTQKFIDHLRQHYCLSSDQPLKDEHVKSYVLEAVDTAVVKAEREVKDAKPQASTPRVRRTRRRKKDA